MKPGRSLAAVAILVLVGCTGGGEGDRASEGTPVESSAIGGTIAISPDGDRAAGVLLQHYGRIDGIPSIGGRAGDSALVAVDATGAPLAGGEPIELHGYASGLVVSPDGRTVAMVVHDDDGTPLVQLVKLETASEGAPSPASILRPPEGADGDALRIGPLRWSADGHRIFWLQSRYAVVNELWSLDVSSREAARVATLDGSGWGPPLVRPDGSAVYALRRPCCEATDLEGDPYIVAIDVESGREIDRVFLPALEVSSSSEQAPAAALSPDGSRIYVVHADADVLTSVTTAPLTAGNPAEFGPRRSARARLGGWILDRFATRAEAKPMGLIKSAVVSPDGRRLYVTGARDVPCADDPYAACLSGDPRGLQIVDLDSMRIISHQPLASRVTVSPDGSWLAATGSVRRWDDVLRRTVVEGFGLVLLDATTGEEIASLERGLVVQEMAVSRDSRYLCYLTSAVGSGCAPSCQLLTVFDLQQAEIVSTRLLGPWPVSLVSLAQAP